MLNTLAFSPDAGEPPSRGHRVGSYRQRVSGGTLTFTGPGVVARDVHLDDHPTDP